MSAVSQTSIAFTVVPGKTISLDAPADIRLSQAALNDILVDQKRSSLKLSYLSPLDPGESDDDDEEDLEDEDKKYTINIANFIPGTVETQSIGGLIINSGEKVFFEATGKNTIHISGNVILQEPMDLSLSDDELDDDDEEGEEIDDEEVAGMDDTERDTFLKALSRSNAMEVDGKAKEPTKQPTGKKSKEDKKKAEKEKAKEGEQQPPKGKSNDKKERGKEKSSGKQLDATTTGPATTTTAAGSASAPLSAVAESKKRKGIETSPSSSKNKDKDGKAKEHKAEKKDKEGGPPAKKAKGDDGKPVPATAGDAEAPKEKKQSKKPETRTTPGGVKITDNKLGDGPGAKPHQTLSMRYILRLANGKVIDKNTSGKPLKFKLGSGDVIKGFDEGLVGMKVGGERKLEVPPNMGYGKKPSSDIPANSTLFFEVKLLDIGK